MDLNVKKQLVLARLSVLLENELKMDKSLAQLVVGMMSSMVDVPDCNATALEIAAAIGTRIKVALPDRGDAVIDGLLAALKENLKADPIDPVVPPAPPAPTPEPPAPGPVPPAAGTRGSMFFPLTPGVPWDGNRNTDSLLHWSNCHGKPWEDQFRRNGLAAIKKCGGNAMVYISELGGQMWKNQELRMFLANEAHPEDGHHIADKENWVKIAANEYGIDKTICFLLNDDEKDVPDNAFPDYFGKMGRAYEWATPEQVFIGICLEANDRFDVDQTAGLCRLAFEKFPGKHILVGSTNPDWLLDVRGKVDIDMWLEADVNPNPLYMGMKEATQFMSDCRRLKARGRTWVGEYGDGASEASRWVTTEALKDGDFAGIGSWVG